MLKTLFVILLVCVPFFLQSCNTVGSSLQEVEVLTKSADARVYLDDEFQGVGDTVMVELGRDLRYKQIRIERPGYKDTYAATIQGCLTSRYFFSFGFTSENQQAAKVLDYPDILSPEIRPLKRVTRQGEGKYLHLTNIEAEVPRDSFQLESDGGFWSGPDYKTLNQRSYNNSVFTSVIIDTLVQAGFMDTTRSAGSDMANTLFLEAEVSYVQFNVKKVLWVSRGPRAYTVDIRINWLLQDGDKRTLLEIPMEVQSDRFGGQLLVSDIEYRRIMGDAIVRAYYTLMNMPEVQNHLNI